MAATSDVSNKNVGDYMAKCVVFFYGSAQMRCQ